MTAQNYTLTVDDVGSTIYVEETAYHSNGDASQPGRTASSYTVAFGPPVPVGNSLRPSPPPGTVRATR